MGLVKSDRRKEGALACLGFDPLDGPVGDPRDRMRLEGEKALITSQGGAENSE